MAMRFQAIFACAFLMLLALPVGAWCAEKTPAIEFISPREGERVRGEITVAATVTPESIVEVVDFYIQEPGAKDRYSWKEYGPSPYVWGGKGQKLDTRLFPDGPASAVLFCYAGGRKPAAEKRVHFIIDNGRPFVHIVSPADGASVHGTLPIIVEASDSGRQEWIAAIYVYLDGTLMRSLTKPPFQTTIDTCLLTPGKHSLRVVAQDINGLTGESSRMLTLEPGSAKMWGSPP